MTTGQTVIFDQTSSARFDDDGGAPSSLLTAGGSARRGPALDGGRLSLALARGRASFDGAWWPRTWRLTSELPALMAALSAAGERVGRISVNGDIWTDIPSRLTSAAGQPLRVSWFRTLDPHAVTLSSSYRPRLFLLVIPPQTAPERAGEVLRMAANGRLVGPAAQILRHAGALSPAE